MNFFLLHKLPGLLLLIFFGLYLWYFSTFSILRMQSLYSHYFDLGIMNQASYNSYMAIKEADYSRFLEITDPHDSLMQVKRMAIHNDIILGFLGVLYFIYSGPETLLFIQTFIVSIGGIFIYLISKRIFVGKYSKWIALAFAISYFLYPPLQKALNFDFHAITLSVTFMLAFFYFYLKKSYWLQALFAFLTLITKEQIGLVIFGFCVFQFIQIYFKARKFTFKFDKQYMFPLVMGLISLIWVILSLTVVIPYFRAGAHFGSEYYDHILKDPLGIFGYIFGLETFRYMYLLLAPVGLLSLLSPLYLFIAASEFGVNILSSNSNMRNIFFHYDTGLTAIIFISSIYGGLFFLKIFEKISSYKLFLNIKKPFLAEKTLIIYLLSFTFIHSYLLSPLPFSLQKDIMPFRALPKEVLEEVYVWQNYLADDVKVSTTGRLAPFFTSRRYFYDFAGGYEMADFVIVYKPEFGNSFQKKENDQQYSRLKRDNFFMMIYQTDALEVYKRVGDI